MKLAVIMPVFNEAPTLDAILERVLAQPCVAEVVAVDDGSTDGSWEILQQWATACSAGVPPASEPSLRPGLALSGGGTPACAPSAGRPPEPAAGDGCATRIVALRHERNQGKGAAIHTALAHVQSEWVLIQDADLEYDPADYAALLEPIRSGRADVVYGSRFAAHQNADATWHTWGNRLLTWASNRVTGLRLTDEATCYKLLRTADLRRMELRERGFGFCPEVTAKVARMALRLVEVPVSYRGRARAEGKKIRLRDGLRALWCLVNYGWLGRRG